ncbi:MAG: hypothetical protein JWO19_917 [Bryobacterales bacterium]|nr:hypothetical protein [Bryobacterales bacterium]
MALITAVSEYCDVCKTTTKRCQYYPAGRSRRHSKYLECDRNDPRSPKGLQSKNPQYCSECDREQNQPKSY